MSQTPLISITEVEKSFGGDPLFSGITFAINENDRLALIGPNGSGKSTLLKILAKVEPPDGGDVRARNGIRSAYVAQQDVFDESKSVYEILEETLTELGYDHREIAAKIEVFSGRAEFPDKNINVSGLSGGWKKRLAITNAIITEPELLILDEPTNHLDIDGVIWLEKVINDSRCGIIFVSHDRYFIENVAKRVIEINRQYPRGYFSSPGNYSSFLEARADFIAGLHRTKETLENRARREVEWLRQGAKARTTKSKYRSEQAYELLDEIKGFKLGEQRAEFEFAGTERKSKDLIKLENVSKSMGGKVLFKDLNFLLSPGVKLGVVGRNGSGKTTFIKTVLGDIAPDTGKVKISNFIRISFFDQSRNQLNKELTLKDTLAPDSDSVVFNDKQIHIVSWAERFLFTRDQLSLKISSLSGGEQARALLAKVMLEPSDILLFDEPTNDLDIKTLEVLEESFNEYSGAIILITHDRYMLDRTTNVVLGLGHNGSQFYGDYRQWENAEREIIMNQGSISNKSEKSSSETEDKAKTKLSFNEKRELDNIEKEILKAEAKVEKLKADVQSEKTASDPELMRKACELLAQQQEIVDNLYSRWDELETLKKSFKK